MKYLQYIIYFEYVRNIDLFYLLGLLLHNDHRYFDVIIRFIYYEGLIVLMHCNHQTL